MATNRMGGFYSDCLKGNFVLLYFLMPEPYERHSPNTTPQRTQRDLIISAGAKNFHAQGYVETGVSDIHIDAQVRPGEFSQHFSSTAAVGHAVLEASFADITSTEAFRAGGTGFANKLHAFQETVDLFPGIGASLTYSEPGQPPALPENLLPTVYQELLVSAEAEGLGGKGRPTAKDIASIAISTIAIPGFGKLHPERTSFFLKSIAPNKD